MTDVETEGSEQYVSETDASSVSEAEIFCPPPPPPRIRAKTARDLVVRQEQLVNMLHKMKSDLSKMDREARSIKEDVVRSNQLFHVMVNMREPHHLVPSADGYNMSYSMPKVTYSYYRRPSHIEARRRHLSELTSLWPSSSSSRRSSVSSQFSDRQRLVDEDQTDGRQRLNEEVQTCRQRSVDDHRANRRSRRRDTRYASPSAADKYSGTESECDGINSRRCSRNSTTSNVSQDSPDSQTEAAGSSTESMSSLGRSSPEVYRRTNNGHRRSSYFYTASNRQTDYQNNSDDVEL